MSPTKRSRAEPTTPRFSRQKGQKCPFFCLTSPWRAAAGVAARISDRYSIWQNFARKSGLHMRVLVSLKSPSGRRPIGFVKIFTIFCFHRPVKHEYRICRTFIRPFDNKLSKIAIFLAFFHKKTPILAKNLYFLIIFAIILGIFLTKNAFLTLNLTILIKYVII